MSRGGTASFDAVLVSRQFPHDNRLKFEWTIIQANRDLLAASKGLPATRELIDIL
jgi:hypothetical protein